MSTGERRPYTPHPVDRRQWGCLFEVLETLVLTIVIFLLIQNFVAQPYQVEQQSMEHTLEPGQYVLVDKLTPRFNDYQRGDIIVFNPPGSAASDPTQVPFIKRIIGLPGDRIDFRNGDVFVNGVQLDRAVHLRRPADPGGGHRLDRRRAGRRILRDG